jgi:hypothetical protein
MLHSEDGNSEIIRDVKHERLVLKREKLTSDRALRRK